MIPKFSCRVLNSSFSFEFVVEFRIRISRFVAPFDFSIFVSCFEFELVVEISRRNFRCLALFDFSNLALNSSSNSTSRISLLYSISRISIFDSSVEFKFLEFSCRISNSNFSFRCSIRLLEFRVFDSSSRVKSLEFRIRLDLFDFSNFDSKLSSKLSFASRILHLSS